MRHFVADHVPALVAAVGMTVGLLGGGSGLYRIAQYEHHHPQPTHQQQHR